ncbi:dockerin type I domain-containing protein [Allorhodopirellula solitaria]|uniref:Dockerin type I repeat protein n=1 Tax=Allorhodopirellula solitaria TaxID=2527987 RepID=A0A5C5YFE0_9BACT|nr:dockerin type I domain-containing protein [Allorhodopirellula solitaria]TWT73241.1 Dockerin type I repeat protein [Allorhodopirellula solitaria]
MTIGKPGKRSSNRSFRGALANRLGLGGLEGGSRKRGNRSSSTRDRRAAIERRLQSQMLEQRQLLAGPELVGIQPNSGQLIQGGSSLGNAPLVNPTVLQTSPNELLFQFDDNSSIDVSTLLNPVAANDDSVSPKGLSITRAGADGGFETASAITDFGTSSNANVVNQVEVEFRAAKENPGVEGNGTVVRLTSANLPLSAAPVLITAADPDLKTIDIRLNSNPTRPATVADLLKALESSPANGVVTAFSVHGSTQTPIGNKLPSGGETLTLDGANTARAVTDLGLGPTTQVRFLASQSGESGRAVSVKIVGTNLGSSSTPLVSVANDIITVRINNNSAARSTVGELIAAVNNSPTAAQLVEASLQRGESADAIAAGFTTVTTSTPNGLQLGGATDTVVTPGYVGIGDRPNEVVFRFAEALPDDSYQIEVYGTGDRALLNTNDEAFNDGEDFAVQFSINAPPRVLAVVPEPVSKTDGRLISEPNVAEVYFTNDVNASVLNKDYYTAVFTRDTVTGGDDEPIKPISVESIDGRTDAVRVIFEAPFSRTPDPDNAGSFIDGAVRFRIGDETLLPSDPSVIPVIEAGDSITRNPLSPVTEPGPMVIGAFNGSNTDQTTSVRLTGGVVENPSDYDLQYPGGTGYEGVRDIRPDDPTRDDRVVPLGIWREDGDMTPGISTIYYNFPDQFQGEDFGTQTTDLNQTYLNLITEQQKTRVREVASLFSEYLGVQFIEVGQDAAEAITSPNFTGPSGPIYSITVGELAGTFDGSGVLVSSAAGGVTVATRELDDLGNTFLALDPDASTANGNELIVLDGQDFDQSTDDFTGGEFFRGVFLGVGQLLGFGYADHLPQPITQSTESVLDPLMPTQNEIPATTDSLFEPNESSYPAPADIVNGQFLYKPESNDIDLYKFTLANAGTINVSTIAERLASSSTLDTMLRLYKIEGGVPIEIAANDDYFSNDSMIEIKVQAGEYVVGVSASGNDNYDPIIPGTGIGGVTQGEYEVAMTFTPTTSAADAISDGSQVLDGDADGKAGGLFQYWFEPNDANTTVFVDNTATAAGTGTPGSITNPFQTLNDAFQSVESRRLTTNAVEVVRVVSGGTYQIGRNQNGSALTSGELTDIQVPKDVNLILDAGVKFEMRGSHIGVGSTSASQDGSNASVQVLGTPDQPVQLVGFGTNPQKGTWGGIDLRGDIDFADDSRVNMETNGVFLNHIQYADIQHAGGVVSIDGVPQTVAPIELAETRATIINSMISQSADAAIAATPNTFAETRFDESRYQDEVAAGAGLSYYFTSDFVRTGPHIRGNTILDNTYNGLLIRIDTPTGGSLETLEVNARFDDTDIVHILIDNLIIEGSAGGPVSLHEPPSLLLAQANGVVNAPTTPSQVAGEVPAGEYAYRMTFVTKDGFESAASDPSIAVTLSDTGKVQLNNLPTVPTNTDYAGRRLYRAPITGTDADGQPIYGEFVRVARLNTSSTAFEDKVAEGLTPLDPERVSDTGLALAGRLDPGLTIDPGTIVKLNQSRIDVTFGARLYAEGTATAPIVMTSLNDRRYGAGGTFNTNGLFQDSTPGATTAVEAGDWGGVFAAFGAEASFDHAVLAGGGGTTRVEGGFASFNVIEAHQSDLRVANTRFENNDDGRGFVNDEDNSNNNPDDPREERVGRVNNASGTIFVRAAQPVITGNTFVDGNGPAMTFDVNSFTWQEVTDYGRSTANPDAVSLADNLDAMDLRGNNGPLIKGNSIDTDGSDNGGLAGLEVRGGKVATEVVWDDTDIVHIVRDTIEVPNQHIYGGLRIESDARASLVVKLANQDEGVDDALLQRRAGIIVGGNSYTAEDQLIDIADRVGGSLQIVGMPDFPVILTSLSDDAVGAGFTPDGRANVDTDNNGIVLDQRTSTDSSDRLPPLLPLSPSFGNNDSEVDLGRQGGGVAPDAPYLIDDDVPADAVGHLQTAVGNGGRIDTIEVTGFDAAQQQQLATANLAFLYTTFINVTQDTLPGIPNPAPIELSDAFLPTQPIAIDLTSDDRVVSSGTYDIDYELAGNPAAGTQYPTVFGRQIRWQAETFILDNRGTIYTQLTFETADGLPFDAGRINSIDVISYDNSGSPGLDDGNNLLYEVGTPGQADFRLTTVNQDNGLAFSHGGVYVNDSLNQDNATYTGFSAGAGYVLGQINNDQLVSGLGTSLDGAHFQPGLQFLAPPAAPTFEGVTPGTSAIGPAGNFDTAHAWRLDNDATDAKVTSFLEFIPSDPSADPFPFDTSSNLAGVGTWDGIVIREAASDSNASLTAENEPANVGDSDTNALASRSQYLGEVAPDRASGDENRRLGLIVDGELSSSSDIDVYSFVAEAGTQVWIDIDRTDLSLDTVVELVNANGQTIVLSDDAMAEAAAIEELLSLDAADPSTAARRAELTRIIESRTGRGADGLSIDSVFGLATGQIDASGGLAAFQDNYSINSRDAGMRVILPGVIGQKTLYHVRIRSAISPQSKATLTPDEKNKMVVGDTSDVAVDEEDLLNQSGSLRAGLTSGSYQLQVRIEEPDVFAGTQIRYSDVLYADNGVQVIGGPMHSPLSGEDFETAGDNGTLANAQRLGLYDTQFTGDPDLPANVVVQPDGSILISRDDAQSNRVDVELNNGAGPLSSDRLAKNISGTIDGIDDVDWYEFEIDYQKLTRDDAAMYLATVFDIDYADGASRADLSLYVFDGDGNLVLIGGDSNIADDISLSSGGTSDLSRGSFGTADPYIGSAELPEGTYYVAVSNKFQAPSQLDQFTSRDATNPLVRLEPIDSTRRIAEEGFNSLNGFSNYSQVAEGPIVPVLFDDDSIVEQTLDDVFLYVNSGSGLFLVNPFTGERYADLGGFGTEIRDVAFTANGELFGYTVPQDLNDGSYQYTRIDTVTAGLTNLGGTGIGTFHDLEVEEDAVQVLDEDSDDGLVIEGITIRARFGNETGYFVADRPVGQQGLEPGPGLTRQGYTENILYAFDEETGEATGPDFDLTLSNAGAGTNIREIGQIDTHDDPDDGLPEDANVIGVSAATAVNSQGVAVPQLYDGDTFTLTNGTDFVTFELNQGFTLISSNPASIPNGTILNVTLPGQAPVTFELTNAGNATTPGNIVVPIDRSASDTVFIESLAKAIQAEGIPVSYAGTQLALPTATAATLTPPSGNAVTGLALSGSNLVQPGNVPVTLLPTDTAETLSNRIVQAISVANANGSLPTVIGTSLGNAVRVTGVVVSADSVNDNLKLGGYANGGRITGVEMIGSGLYAVSDNGGLYYVPPGPLGVNFGSNNNVGQYVQSATDLIGINFTGLRAGPNNLLDAQGRQILFGITGSGTIHAFNLEGELQGVFAGGRTSIETGINNAQGLDFSTLNYNLWHVSDARGDDEGHGINESFSGARPDQNGNNSLVFNYTDDAFNGLYAPGEAPVENRTTDAENVRQDGQAVHNTYNFPGGARGEVQSNAFSLEGYAAADVPMMYFNYFLETDGVDQDLDANGNPINSLFGNDQDSLRVYVVDQSGVEHLVATNNEARRDGTLDDEFDDPAEFGIYDDDIDVDVQQLYDNTGTWRQARVPLDQFAGQSGLSLRIEFATAGTTSTLTGEIRAVGGSQLVDGETLVINGETFSIDLAPTVTFSSGTSLAELYTDPAAISSFTVDGQQYVLNDGTRVIPAGAISINVLQDFPAGTELSNLTAGDIARAVAAPFDSQIDLDRMLPSGTEIEQFYATHPLPTGVDPNSYYAANPDELYSIYLNGTEYVLIDTDSERADLDLPFDDELFAARPTVDVLELYKLFNPTAPTTITLDDLSVDDVAEVVGLRIGETDQAVDYDQLVPSGNALDNYYINRDATFIVTIDDVEYVLDDGLRTLQSGQISVPLGSDVTQVDIPGELQAAVEANTGVQAPVFETVSSFDFSDSSDPVDPFGNPNSAGDTGRNDLTYQATPLPYTSGNMVIDGRGTLGTITPTLITNRGDVDLSSIDVVAGTTVTVEVTADQPGVENNIRFFDEAGVELRSDNGNLLALNNVAAGTVSFIAPSDSTYYIGISGPENASYDPRIAGSTDAAQTGGYAAKITVQPELTITAIDASVEFSGAGDVTTPADSGLSVTNQNPLTGTPIVVNSTDSPEEVAEALQLAVANRFAGGDISLIPRLGSAVRLPELTFDEDQLGPFTSTAQRYGDRFGGDYQAGASDNAHEGVYIDDIIIGFAERGELVTAATETPQDEAFVDSGELSLTSPPESPRPTQSGPYQLEIRDASEYIASGVIDSSLPNLVDGRFRAFDTNDRLVSGAASLVTKPAAEIVDGSTFTIAGASQRVTFEFDVLPASGPSNGFAQNANRVVVQVASDATAEEVADTIIERINSQQVSSILGVSANRGNLTQVNSSDSVPDKRVNLVGATSVLTNDIGATAFVSTISDDLRGDSNRDRVEQGQIIIENSRFSYNEDAGLQISRAAAESVISQSPLDATPSVLTYARSFNELNSENLIPGVVARNNEFAYNQNVGIDITGLENGGLAAQNPVGFDRIINNTLVGGTITPAVSLGPQVFAGTFYPEGGVSFADSVLDSETMLGPDVEQSFTDSEAALGSPDCYGVSATDPENGLFTFSLGSGGHATFVFEDNLLTGSSSSPNDFIGIGDGVADLQIFEAGIPERVRVEISRDNVTYFNVGEIFGLDNTIDLDAFGFGLNDRFSYVRLTDLSPAGTNNFGAAGADIDAIGAISTVPRESFSPGQTGIRVADNSAPTLLNNIVSNFQTGVAIPPTPLLSSGQVDVSADLTVIGGTTYYRNNQPARISGVDGYGQSAQFINPSDQVFVDPYNLIFTPQSRTPVIDSGIASLEDRASLATLRNSLGLPVSPIVAPLYDANGQLRVDDPTFATPQGVGLSGFIDRGAQERTDNEGPRFVLTSPRGQDLIFDDESDLFGRSVTQGTIYDAFEIQLIDGIRPADTGYGVGVNDNTVTSENLLVTRLVLGNTETEVLQEGIDYRFAYEPADNTIRITPIAGIWDDNAVYTVEFLGAQDGSVDGFNAVLQAQAGVEYSDGDQTFIDGQILETEVGIQLTVPSEALITTDPLTGISQPAISGQTLTISDGTHPAVTFEFVTDVTEPIDADGRLPSTGNYAISLPDTASPTRIVQLLSQAINQLVASQPNVLDIEAVYLDDSSSTASDSGRLQLLGTATNANSDQSYVSLEEDSIFRHVNQELDVQLLPDATVDADGTRLTNYNETINVFDGSREIAFEFDSDGILNVVGPDVNRVVLPVDPDASPRELVQSLLQGFRDVGLDVQASGASGVFRVRGTDGPISVTSLDGAALVTGNSEIGVSPGFGLQIPTTDGETSLAVQDGQTFTIALGLSDPVTFEIDFDGDLLDPGATPVSVIGGGQGGSPDLLANAIVAAVSTAFPSLTPVNRGGGSVTLGGEEDTRLNTASTVLEQIGSAGDPASEPVVIRYNDDASTVAATFADAAIAAGLGGPDGTDVKLVDNRVLLQTTSTPLGDSIVTEFIADKAGNRLQPASERSPSQVEILVGDLYDYGDASLTFGDAQQYPVTIQTNGPRHKIVDGENDALYLGASVTADVNGANDDADIDDGVTLLGTLQPGFTTDFQVSINQGQDAPLPAQASYLDAWFDWNGDGVFGNSPGEVSRVSFPANNPFLINTLSVNVPAQAELGDVQARFRLSYTQDLGALGAADAGEVEDYVFTVVDNPFTGPTDSEDVNASGTVTPLDALLIINVLNANDGPVDLANVPAGLELPAYPDVNGDGRITSLDALRVINRLNSENPNHIPGGEPIDAAASRSVSYTPVADGVMATNATVAFDPTVVPMSTLSEDEPTGEPLPEQGPVLVNAETKSSDTSVFDSPATMQLDSIVDSLAQDREEAQSSQSDNEMSAVDEFFADLR